MAHVPYSLRDLLGTCLKHVSACISAYVYIYLEKLSVNLKFIYFYLGFSGQKSDLNGLEGQVLGLEDHVLGLAGPGLGFAY